MTGEREGDGGLWSRDWVDGVTVTRTYALDGYRESTIRRIASYVLYSVLALLIGLSGSRPSVVLTGSGVPPFITASGWFLARARRSGFVIEDRELYPDAAIALGYIDSRAVLWLWRRYHRFFRHRADRIIALTPGIERNLHDAGIDSDKVRLVTNAYDEPTDEPISDPVPEDLPLDDRFVVLYTGGFGRSNDLTTLLEAARRLTDLEDLAFVFVGDGERKDEYLGICDRNGLDNCYFCPPVPKSQVHGYYERADVCVHLTLDGEIWRGMLANKVFDYLGSGCPMVFAGRGDTAELIEAASAGLVVPPENPDALAEAIRHLHDDPEVCAGMGERAARYVSEHYDRETLLDDLTETLMEAARPRSDCE
jgi:glycosyltransferase involved in cell wall biosynthesis